MKRVGVLALQGAVSEHLDMLALLGCASHVVKGPSDLENADALVLPGGESTAISRLVTQNGLRGPIRAFARERPVLGTCAGLILCAREAAGSGGSLPGTDAYGPVVGADRLEPLDLMDITVSRNGFGRQADSFETSLDIGPVGRGIMAVFIRAPYIERAGPGVDVLAFVEGKAVMAESGTVLVTSFHPELTSDMRVMEYFLAKI